MLAILRHADYRQPEDVPSAHLPWPLTGAGEAQALAAGQSLGEIAAARGLAIHPVIDSSRMLRAWQTADLIRRALALDLEIAEFDALAERSVGAAANLTVTEIESLLAEDPRYEVPSAGWKSRADFRLPLQGAESLTDAGARVASHIEHALDDCGDDELKILVGHGASIRHAMAKLGVLSPDEVAARSMYHASPILLQYVGTGWRQVGGEWKLRQRSGDSDEFRGQP